MKRRFVIAGAIVVVACALALPKVWPVRAESARPPEPRGGTTSSVPHALSVQVFEVQPTPFAETINATGTLRADEGVELQVETAGKVVAIHFHEGTTVRRGDLMVKINDADLQASRLRAVARERLATIREARFAKLVHEGGANQQDYDIAASELEVQRAEIQLIDAQIAKTEVRAPFDGTIGLRFVSPGSFVGAASRIATLQNVDTVKLDFSVPEKYATRLVPGQAVAFTIAGDTETFVGTIYAVEPRIDELTRTLLLRAAAPNTERRLRPGTFAHVTLELGTRQDALLVPAIAVIPGLVEKNVFVIEDGKAVRRSVQTGARTEEMVQIIAGLGAGDIVITSGLQTLRPGQPVRPHARATDKF